MGFSTLPPSIAVVGTYERTLCGWELEGKSDDVRSHLPSCHPPSCGRIFPMYSMC